MAVETLPQYPSCRKSFVSRSGVLTIHGFGVRVRMQSGHLEIEDGIGPERRKIRLARVGHKLRRLVMIGSDGFITFEALRWLADQEAAFTMLDRNGKVLIVTGPVRPSDARLRRAQVLAHQNGTALEITRYLIDEKTTAQEKVARDCFHDEAAARAIAQIRFAIAGTKTSAAIRLLESRAALAYWSAWKSLTINFPKRELHRVPDHWRTFESRISPLTASPRLAANPVNAMLNYVYAVLESEARLAAAALGLDPGLGLLHVDSQARDSLACDIMEPIRPAVDVYILRWITREVLKREWFFEEREGNCRLMGSFAGRLSETASTWAAAVAPIAEHVAQMLWSSVRKSYEKERLPTRLTQRHRCAVKGVLPRQSPNLPRPESFCRVCGSKIATRRTYCSNCAQTLTTAGLIKAAVNGRVAAQSDQAQAQRAQTQQKHATARWAWKESMNPAWLNESFYNNQIKPRLRSLTLSVLAAKLGFSISYAVNIRNGRRIPHPRHWQTLAQLVGVALPHAEVAEY